MTDAMFEGNPISAPGFPRGEGTALRAIGWGELTARLNAAHDLRDLLRRENVCMVASFADAAAGFFGDAGDDAKHEQRVVNPDVLEHRKSTGGMEASAEGNAATSDREI